MQSAFGELKIVLAMAVVASAFGASAALAQPAQPTPPPAPPPQNQGGGHSEGFGIQVIGGPLFANLTDTEGLSTSNKTGWLVGLALGGNRGGRLGVEADVLYGEKGAVLTGVGDFNQHIVDVPVMLKVNIGSSDRNGLTFFGSGGGYFDWQFSSTVNNVDVSSNTNGYEAGFVVGGGVEVMRISAQLRYIRGLREIDKNFDVAQSTNPKTQAVALLFGLRLN